MAVRFALLALIAVAAALLSALPARSQSTPEPWYGQPPACTQQRVGQLSCQVSVLCECRYFPASAMEGTPAGYRWDCSPLRPRCGEARQKQDPTVNPYYGPLPYIYEHDGRDYDGRRYDGRRGRDRR